MGGLRDYDAESRAGRILTEVGASYVYVHEIERDWTLEVSIGAQKLYAE
jgi:hypothetical protein